jgi:hypothetical protein
MREAGLKTIVWVGTIIILSTLLAGSAAGSIQADKSVSQIESANVTVGPQESVQEAIGRAEVGDTVSIPEGTYTQSVDIDKDLTLKGTGEVIFDGNSLDDVKGITITSSKVTIENINVRRFSQAGISAVKSDALSRNITIKNVVSRLNGDYGLFVAAATDESKVGIVNSQFTDNGFSGISGSGEFDEVRLDNVATRNNAYDGITIDTKSITASEISTTNNGGADTFSSDDPGIGLEIDGANKVSIESINAVDNTEENILIAGEPLTRDVTIHNATIKRSKNSDGLRIAEATEEDSVSMTDVSSIANANDGIDINSKDVSINNITVENNEYDGVYLGADSASVKTISANNNGGADTFSSDDPGIGLEIDGAKNISIEDATTHGNTKENILIDGEPLTRSVVIKNVSIKRSEDDDGLRITKATEEDNVTLKNITSTANANDGVEINSKEVYIDNTTVTENTYDGVYLSGDSVTISNTSTNNNGGGEFFSGDDPGIGLEIDGATDITIRYLNATENTKDNILIGGEPLSRDTTIDKMVTSASQDGSGLRITDATEESTAVLSNVAATDNSVDGLYIESDNITITDSQLTGNGDTGVIFQSPANRASIKNSSIVSNGEISIDNQLSGVTVDATGNWWGSAAEPAGRNLNGLIDASQPLSSPPGEQSDSSDEKRISQDVRVTSPQLTPSEVSSASQTRHNLTFNLQNISSDDKRDNLTIKMPESVKIENVNEVSIDNTRYGHSRSGNTISVSVNPDGAEDNVDLPVRVELILTKTD